MTRVKSSSRLRATVVALVVALAASLASATPASATDGTVNGFVQLPDGTAAQLGGTGVGVIDENGSLVATASADPATGAFAVTLAPGQYGLIAGAVGSLQYAISLPGNVSVSVSGTVSPSAPVQLRLRQATVAGHVRNPNGLGVQGAQVQAISTSFDSGAGDFTRDSGGTYALALPPGTYYVAATSPDPQWTASETQQVTVPSTPGAPVLRDLDLRLPNVTGLVLGPGGVPLAHSLVLATPQSGGSSPFGAGSSPVDENGHYALTLPDGAYNLNVFLPPDNPDYLAAAPQAITVQGSPVTQNINVQPGNLRGRILAPDGSTPVPNAYLTVFDGNGQPLQTSASTDAQGRFAVRLPAGSYQVTANPPTNGAPSNYARTTIEVIVGSTTITRTIALANANVTGRVLAPNGTTPVPWVWVAVRDTTSGMYLNEAGAPTDTSGTYHLNLPAGTYELTARPAPNDTSGAVARTITVVVPSAGVLTGRDITLQTANVHGVVRSPEGAPVANAVLDVVDRATGLQLPNTFAFTAGDGSFSFNLANGAYRLTARPPWGSSGWTNGTLDLTVPGANTGLSMTLGSPNVSGIVRDSAANPVANAYVHAQDLLTGQFSNVGSQTGNDGAYALNLPEGHYRLTANPPPINSNGLTPGSIDITVGTTPLTGRTIVLGAPNIRGTVFRPDGTTPVGDSQLDVQDAVTGMYLNDLHARTSANGSYGLRVPTAGSYRITARPPWSGTSTDVARSIVVDVSDTSATLAGRNISLGSANVTGTVVAPDGTTPITGSFIDVADVTSGQYVAAVYAMSNSSGSYALTLPNGTYKLTARPSWNNPSGYVNGTRTVTVAGTPMANQTITLQTANVSGRVFAPNGTTPVPYASVEVTRLDSSGSALPIGGTWTQTAIDGGYGLSLPDGNYRFTVRPAWTGAASNLVATSVNVLVAGPLTRDITLATPSITGVVLAPDGTTPVANSWLEVIDVTAGNVPLQLGDSSRADGTFGLNVPKNGHTYLLRANPSWNNPGKYVVATTTISNLTTDVVRNITLGASNVTGRVLDPGGGSVRDAWIEVRTAAGAWVGWVNTGADGSFGTALADGDYVLTAHPSWNNPSGWTNGVATLHLTTSASGVDVTLGTPNVTGRVEGPDGSPVRDSWISVFDVTNGVWLQNGAFTSVDGSWGLTLPIGTYRLTAHPSWNNAHGWVPVTVDLSVSGLVGSVVLALGSPNVSGRVFDPSGTTAISNAYLAVQDLDHDTWLPGVVTSQDGSYSLSLPAGNYRLTANAPWVNAGHYANGTLNVTVPASGAITGRDILLTSGNVRGVVTFAGGGTAANAFVQVYDLAGTPLAYSAPTRGDGSYSLTLPAGQYKIGALPPFPGSSASPGALVTIDLTGGPLGSQDLTLGL